MGKPVETVIKRYHRRYIIHYHDYIGSFFVTFNTSVCVCVGGGVFVRACLRACSFQLFFDCIFSSWYIFYFIVY